MPGSVGTPCQILHSSLRLSLSAVNCWLSPSLTPLECTLTDHPQLIENTATLSPLERAVPKITRGRIRLECLSRFGGNFAPAVAHVRRPSSVTRHQSRITSHTTHVSHCTEQNTVPQLPRRLATYRPSTGKHLCLLRCLKKESGQRVRQWLSPHPV